MSTVKNSGIRVTFLALAFAALAFAALTALLCVGGGSALADDGAGSGVDASALAAGALATQDAETGSCGAEGNNVTYSLDAEGVLTISGTGAMADYSDMDSPFAGNDAIKQVAVEEGVTSIGVGAFVRCTALASATLPSGLASIGTGAFSGCESLASIDIPTSVTSVGEYAFANCFALKSVVLPDSVTSVGEYAFAYCIALESATLPSGLKTIKEGTFGYCASLTRADIPASVTAIGDGAFLNCWSLKSITIPAGVTSIGTTAFGSCAGLTSITVDEGNEVYDSRNSCNAIIETSSNTLLKGCTKTVIPGSVTEIALFAFGVDLDAMNEYYEFTGITPECPKLTSIAIPQGVTSIGDSAFYGCYGLESVTLPASLVTISSTAFSSCAALKSIDIPDSVTSIGPRAFSYCLALESAQLPRNITSIEANTFDSCGALQSITIPTGVESIGYSAFAGCTALAEITIPEGVTSIGPYAFYNCTGLSTVSIPISMANIGNGAFTNTTVAINFAGSATQWAAIAGSGKPTEPVTYGSLSVVFNTNGGSAIAAQNVQPGEKATRPAEDPTKDRCRFDGWYADAELQTEFDFANTEITADTTIYAKWYAMCTVTFNSCGGSAVETQYVWPGGKATQPADDPTKESREFVGWYADEGYATPFDFANTAITADTTIYAKWRFPGGDDDPDSGPAYAKFDSGTSTFSFFRSWDEYFTGQTKTYIDVDGKEQTITYYADIETTEYSMSNWVYYVPWYKDGNASKVQSVVFECEMAPVSTATWFNGMKQLESITGFDKLDTSIVTDMSRMFNDCNKLSALDVTSMDVSKVTSFFQMFLNCHSLTELDVSNFDTSQAKSMMYMFANCEKITHLDVSGFDTSNVTSLNGMFYYCKSLTTLDVSKFVTSKVKDMRSMFNGCLGVTELDVSGFDTSSVTNMSRMFELCGKVSTLDVSGFDTSNVTDMSYMFSCCEKVSTLDVSSFKTSNVTTMAGMFEDCESLSSIDLSNFNTSNVTRMAYMFEYCYALTDLDVSGFDTSKVTDTERMFEDCTNLKRLDISSFETPQEGQYRMFRNCNALSEIKLGAKTQIANNAELPATEWQLADLGDTSARYDALTDYDGSRPGWYMQGHGDVTIEGVADTAYTGAPIEPTPTVRVGERTLAPGTDYAVSYANNTGAGTATATIAGMNQWTGSANATFQIAPRSITPEVTLSQTSYTYDGKVKTPEVTVRDDSNVLTEGTDYDVTYPAGRTNVGTYSVEITLKGNYSGAGSASFGIAKAANPLVANATAKGKKGVKVKASKLRKKARMIACKNIISVSKAQGAVTYNIIKVKTKKKLAKQATKKIKLATGSKLKLKRGLKKGTYKATIRVTAIGNDSFNPASKDVVVKAKVT